jgi:hypothetical protein
MFPWSKWDNMAAEDSHDAFIEASRLVQEEFNRRGLVIDKVLDIGRDSEAYASSASNESEGDEAG